MTMGLAPHGGALSQQALAQMSGSMQRQTAKEIEREQSRTIIAAVHEDGRAFLTNKAQENASALSAFEAHLITVAPLGEARYKLIVDAYALGAAQAISRW